MGWVVIATPRPHNPRESPSTHRTGGWVVPRVGVDGRGKSHPHPDSIHGPSRQWRVAILNTLPRPTMVDKNCGGQNVCITKYTWWCTMFPVPALSLEIIIQAAITNSFSIITCITLKTLSVQHRKNNHTTMYVKKKQVYLLTSKTKSCAFLKMSQSTR
jgi:hypothetical protein